MLATEINLTSAEGLMSDFYKYFKENMEALGLPAPGERALGALTVVALIALAADNYRLRRLRGKP